MSWRQNEKGFTIIELIVTMTLFLTLLTPLYALLITGIRSYQLAETGINHHQNLRIAMEAITHDLLECAGLTGMASTTKLDQYNLLLKTREGDTIWYYRSGENLRWAKLPKGERRFFGHNPVANGISLLHFSYNNVPIMESTQVTIMLEGTDELGRSYQLTSTISLRLD